MNEQDLNSRDEREVVLRSGQYPVDEDGYDNFHYWLGQVRLMTLLAREGSSDKCIEAIRDALGRGLAPEPYIQAGSGGSIVHLVADACSGPTIWGHPSFRSPRHARMLVDELRDLVGAVETMMEAGMKL